MAKAKVRKTLEIPADLAEALDDQRERLEFSFSKLVITVLREYINTLPPGEPVALRDRVR